MIRFSQWLLGWFRRKKRPAAPIVETGPAPRPQEYRKVRVLSRYEYWEARNEGKVIKRVKKLGLGGALQPIQRNRKSLHMRTDFREAA